LQGRVLPEEVDSWKWEKKVSDTTMDGSKCNDDACHIRSRPCSVPLKPSELHIKLLQRFKDCP